MSLFDSIKSLFGGGKSRPPPMALPDAIEAFWTWWAEHREQLDATVTSGLTPALIEGMSARVDALHADLGWEFSKGDGSQHALTVTGNGDRKLRLIAEKWRIAGPGNDEVWSFHTAKPPLGASALAMTALQIGPHELTFGDVRVGLGDNADGQSSLDVRVWHPCFDDLPDPVRGQITFIILDSALGEDGVERWLGAIEPVRSEPDNAVDLAELRRRTEALAAIPEQNWMVGQGPDARTGQPCVYVLDGHVKAWDHPRYETFVRIRLPYAENDGGMPADPEVVPVFDALEESLLAAVGTDAAYLGRRTGAGERQLFLYVDGAADTAGQIQTWAEGCGRPCHVDVEADPMWELQPG